GGAAYAKLGTEKSAGTRLMSVSGNVNKPGVYEVELGQTFRHVIMELGGGVPEGRDLKVFWPGGSSAPVLPASMLDTKTDMESLAAARSMGGSGGVIVMDDTHCVVKAAHRLLQFYAHESCGKCTPCRIGGDWAVRTYERILDGEGSQGELDPLIRVSDGLHDAGLGRHGRADAERDGGAGARGHPGVRARQPPARLPGLRQGRGVPSAGLHVPPRLPDQPHRRATPPLQEADPAFRQDRA